MTTDNNAVPAAQEVSLGYSLIDRVWFGDDTMTARLGDKYGALKPGDQIEFTPRDESGNIVARIPSEITEVRKIKLKDILTLSSAELAQAGAEQGSALYDSQFHWYGDNINDNTDFYLVFYKPPVVAADLQSIRNSINNDFSQFCKSHNIKADASFSYENAFDLGDGIKKTPALVITLNDDGSAASHKVLRQYRESLNSKLGKTLCHNDNNSLTILVSGAPADLKAKLAAPAKPPLRHKRAGPGLR